MRVFCSQCGTPNEGEPGTKVICTSCTTVFEIPAGVTPVAPPSEPVAAPPLAQTYVPPAANLPPTQQPSWGAPMVNPGQPGPTFPAPMPGAGGPTTHGLAIASLVLGIVCCIPFSGIAALITGYLAIQKIDANPQLHTGRGLAVAGMILGGLSIVISVIFTIVSLASNH
jgi:hypothetical protein